MNKRKILFIDDDEAVLRMIKLVLERTGEYEVATQSKSQLAMLKVRQFNPEMIFIDINMPEKEGSELAAEIRAEHYFSTVPIVFLTGAVSIEEVEQSDGRIGGELFIAKPIDMEKLVDCIKQNLG